MSNQSFYRRFLENSGQPLLKLACLTKVLEDASDYDEQRMKRQHSWQQLVNVL